MEQCPALFAWAFRRKAFERGQWRNEERQASAWSPDFMGIQITRKIPPEDGMPCLLALLDHYPFAILIATVNPELTEIDQQVFLSVRYPMPLRKTSQVRLPD